jgi:nucleotidyltransferase/DNA polymerase involved in DNA repair
MGAAAPDPEKPLVLVGQTGRRREVVAANAAAFQAGLRIGIPATQAQALVADLVIHHADPAADAEALERLAVWALRYSPLVAADAPDGIIIDATGATHLHGGEDAMLADMVSRPNWKSHRLNSAAISRTAAPGGPKLKQRCARRFCQLRRFWRHRTWSRCSRSTWPISGPSATATASFRNTVMTEA